MSKSNVTVYTMKYCPYCDSAKALLKQRGVPFEEIVLDTSDDTAWDELYKRSGMRTMPQIFAGERLIGGYSELAELDAEEGLDDLKNG